MEMFKDNKFTVLRDDGTEITCDVLFTFDSEETGKSYVVYTDGTKDEGGNVQIFASVYDPTGENLKLMPVETEQEWVIIETILRNLQNQIMAKAMGVEPEDYDPFDTIIEEE